MPERFYHPGRQKLKYQLLLFIVLFILTFSSLVYSSCPAFVQCTPEEARSSPVCVQACTLNFNLLLLIIIALISYVVPSVVVHHHNR